MEGLFGIIVMLYVVASVVGAVLKRMQQGPILDHPVFPPSAKPQKQGQVGEEQPREMGDVVVVAMPPVADTPPAMEGQLVEVFESTEEPSFDSVESDVADEQDIWEGLGRSERDYDIAAKPSSASGLGGTTPAQGAQSAIDWRRAVILAEVLDKPRGIRPYRLPGAR